MAKVSLGSRTCSLVEPQCLLLFTSHRTIIPLLETLEILETTLPNVTRQRASYNSYTTVAFVSQSTSSTALSIQPRGSSSHCAHKTQQQQSTRGFPLETCQATGANMQGMYPEKHPTGFGRETASHKQGFDVVGIV